MRQILLLAVLFTLGFGTAKAEVFDCTFSEPALNLKYNSETQSLTVKKDLLGAPEVTEGVSFHILSSGIFVLKASGKQVAKLTLNNNGSDGLTETLYPFEIELTALTGLSHRGLGGCSSSLLKSVNR